MKPIFLLFLTILVVVKCEPPASKRSLHYTHWPPKSAKQHGSPKTKTLMVQIRSDHPVPIVFKGRPGPTHTHGQFMQTPYAHSHSMPRRPRPVKLSSPIYLKNSQLKSLRQPLKFKLSNLKIHQSKPIAGTNYDKPYKYEKPSTVSYMQLDLPSTTKANFISEHFAPIHTIPAPNLSALHDNHIHQHDELHASSPKPQPYHPKPSSSHKNINNNHLDHQYQVLEDITNDATFIDPISESQKLFAPDPDPSLPTTKVRPATEPYNQPSNRKPYPNDVRNNLLLPVQIIGAEQAKLTAGDVYSQQSSAQLHPFISPHLTAIQAAPISNYDPTYLVTQSNNLYSQHRQQLFTPHFPTQSIPPGYANFDLTQEVASDGQILQAAKHQHRNVIASETLPQFSALIAAPALNDAHSSTAAAVAPFHLPNAAIPDTQGGFVISNYYNNGVQDSSQLLNAYAEEEAQAEADLAAVELQKLQQHQQQQQQQQQLLQEQEHQQQLQLQQEQHEQEQQLQQLQLQQQIEQHQQLQQLQQIHEAANAQNQFQSQQLIQEQAPVDAVAPSGYEERQRLLQQQLANNKPLRIFVPDDDESRLQKRADKRTAQADSSPEDNQKSQ